MVNRSVQMTTHAVNCLQVSMVAVLFLTLFAAVMESTAVQMDTPVIRQLELVTKELKLCHCCRCLHQRQLLKPTMLFAPMVNLSVQMATHAANCLQVSMVAVLFLTLFAAVMESTAVQMDTPVILQLELVTKELKLCHCCRCLHQRQLLNPTILCAPMVNLSVQMATRAANCLQVSMVVVLFLTLFAAVMVFIAVHMDTSVILQLELAPKE